MLADILGTTFWCLLRRGVCLLMGMGLFVCPWDHESVSNERSISSSLTILFLETQASKAGMSFFGTVNLRVRNILSYILGMWNAACDHPVNKTTTWPYYYGHFFSAKPKLQQLFSYEETPANPATTLPVAWWWLYCLSFCSFPGMVSHVQKLTALSGNDRFL